MTLAASALAQLATWPDLAEAEPSCGIGRALRTAHGEIAHFHSDDHVDLYLTAATAVQLVPGSQWVTLRLDVTADIHLLMTLASLALQTRQAWPVQGDVPQAECNDQRSAVRPHENLGGG
ncbi:luciferase family protein [Streptomyces phaeochromogenes]|uniref:luciferase domain-containing protein n=1 Tax=Streptomyces phaeochromogenes TaxID=1923 RepID=UPI0006E3A509|nr:luciferase family protein [Streptomyces phaeochromogenes]